MKTKQDFPSINERPPEGLKEDGSCYKILVVDDSMFVAKQIGQILTSEGYEIVEGTVVDQFPHTVHTEAVVKLHRKNA